MRITLVALLLITSYSLKAQNKVRFWGKAPEYKNMGLTITSQTNFITRQFNELSSFLVAKDGNFDVTFEVSEITKVYISLGEIQAYLWVEPGVTYNIVLPPYIPLKQEDKLNPFFKPQQVVLGVINQVTDNVNKKVLEFDEFYNSIFSKNIARIVLTKNKKACYDIINKTDEAFPADSATWFYNYKFYSYFDLYDYIYSNKPSYVMNMGFSEKPIRYQLDTYWSAFNKVYSDFLHYYFNSNRGAEFKKSFETTTSFDTICNSLTKDSLFANRQLAELVLIKSIYDGFYSDMYNKEKLIEILESAEGKCSNQKNERIAREVLDKISKLLVGSEAPSFDLYTLSGRKTKSLNDFDGKFVYLNFANTKNYACKKDFQVLEELASIYKRDMRIVTILTDEDPDEALRYINHNQFSWTFLHFGQNAKVLMDYNIKAFPTYYLINPEGELVLSPAPAPEENFAPAFSEVFNNYRHKKLRQNRPKARTIYDL